MEIRMIGARLHQTSVDKDATHPRPLRLLCLHGYASNNDITKLQTQFLRFTKANGVVCDFFHGNIEVPPLSERMRAFTRQPFYSWYDRESSGVEEEVRRCVNEVKQILQDHGPYDGIYGFSLGAMLATCLCAEETWKGAKVAVRFVVLACAGGYERFETLSLSKEQKLQIPSLHILGDIDPRKAFSAKYIDHFEGPVVYTHPYGHEIPMKLLHEDDAKHAVESFLAQFTVSG